MAMDKYLWILLATLLLASCSANDCEEQAGGSAIASVVSFDVTTDDAATRGIIANTTEFATEGRQFCVWAYMDDGNGGACNTAMISDYNSNPLTGVVVTYNAVRQQWRTQDSYWWPRPEYAVDFYAIYPTEIISEPEFFNKTLDYTAPTNPDDAVDVMYATYHGQRDGTEKPDQKKYVDFRFHHALTQVSFYGHLSSLLYSLGWHVEVNSITLCNVYSTGSLALTTGEYSTHAKQFTNFTELDDYEFTMNPDRERLVTYSTPANELTGKTLLTSPTDVTMLLPQTLTAWDTANEKTGDTAPSTSGCYLAVAIRIWDDASQSYILGTSADDGFVTVYSPFNCVVAGGWKAGQHYNYILTFNGGYDASGHPVVKDIEVSASITPWTTTNVDGGNIYR